MKKWFMVSMIIAILIASGCVSDKTAQNTEDIKIGVLITYTGGLGPIGEGMANGAKLAAMEINNKGIIKGRNVTLIIEDTGTDPAKAVEASRKLIDIDKVQVIIGGVGSSETLAIAPYAEKSKVVMISPSSTNLKITDAGEYIFRVVPSDLLQGEAISKLAAAKNFKKAATLVENNDYGIGMEDVFKKHFSGNVTSIRYEKGKGDYRTELESIKKANPDVIIYVGYPADASVILKEAGELGLKKKWIAAEGIADPVMFDNAEVAKQMEGMLLTTPGRSEQEEKSDAAFQYFVNFYKQTYGKEYGIYSDTEFDATMLAAYAIAEAGNNGTAIKNALPEMAKTYKAATGDKTFDENGDVRGGYKILEVRNKTMVPVGSWNPAAGIMLQ
ncbi:MAG: ABC transporter substrate-binding protein [Candidatus Methanoperedens sp.]|nr:ABC transporter substrate-binding protein [Candidatus Methanoperedens sp.]